MRQVPIYPLFALLLTQIIGETHAHLLASRSKKYRRLLPRHVTAEDVRLHPVDDDEDAVARCKNISQWSHKLSKEQGPTHC